MNDTITMVLLLFLLIAFLTFKANVLHDVLKGEGNAEPFPVFIIVTFENNQIWYTCQVFFPQSTTFM